MQVRCCLAAGATTRVQVRCCLATAATASLGVGCLPPPTLPCPSAAPTPPPLAPAGLEGFRASRPVPCPRQAPWNGGGAVGRAFHSAPASVGACGSLCTMLIPAACVSMTRRSPSYLGGAAPATGWRPGSLTSGRSWTQRKKSAHTPSRECGLGRGGAGGYIARACEHKPAPKKSRTSS